MYCISDWDHNYEVDKDGRSWKPGKDFFAGPLPYTRAPSRRDWPVRLLQIRELVGDDVHTIVGVFERLCGIVACEKREYREGGIIRNSKHEPATVHEIARMLLWPDEKAQWALDVLCDPEVEWMAPSEPSQGPAESRESREPRESRESRDNPQDSKISATVEVMSYQYKSESRDNSNSEKAPRIVPFHDLDEKAPLILDLDPDRPDTKCFEILARILQPKQSEDFTALSNFVKWLHANVVSGRAGPDSYNKVIGIAKDSINGDCPMAVFTSRIKKQWGYEPPSRRAKEGYRGQA